MVCNLFHRLSLPASILSLVVASFLMAIAVAPDANAQSFSGRGVDMRALDGQAAQCRRPALRLQQRVIVLRQGIRDILECNASGGLFQRDRSCVPAVSPTHTFEADRGSRNEDALSFDDPDGWALIGGADGQDAECCQDTTDTDIWPCPAGQSGSVFDHYRVNCATGARTFTGTTDTCTDIPCEEDPDHPDYPDCGTPPPPPPSCEEDPTHPDYPECGRGCDPVTDTECPGFCTENPNHENCVDDSCDPATDSECPGFCTENPDHESCNQEICTWQPDANWSECDKSCGGGIKTKSYSCSCGNASDCPGTQPEDLINNCNIQFCSWNPPGEWGECSESCGGGTKTRTVTCSGPGACDPDNKPDTTADCNEQACPPRCGSWNWDIDIWCGKDAVGNNIPACNRYNMQSLACGNRPFEECWVQDVNYLVNNCGRCVVTGEKCVRP